MVSLPAMEALRAAYTGVWAPSAHLPLFRFADAAWPLLSTGIERLGLPGLTPEPRLMERLRSFDSIVSWYGSNRPEFREAVAGLPIRFLDALPSGGVHACDFYCAQAGIAPAAPNLRLPRRDGGYAVIHPFSGSARKNWPLENYRAVALWLERRMPVHWCAGPEETLDGATRFDDLGRLAEWLAGARVYVGNDSGVTHLAAAAGTSVVAIFVASDPAVWAPRGARVLVRPGVEDVIALLAETYGG